MQKSTRLTCIILYVFLNFTTTENLFSTYRYYIPVNKKSQDKIKKNFSKIAGADYKMSTDNHNADIYINIRQLCKDNKISIRKLEREIGLGNSAISKWTDSVPSSTNLKKVADYFNVSIDYLLGVSKEKFSYPYSIVAESHARYELENEKELPKGHKVVDACDVLNYMIECIDARNKTVLFNRADYNEDEAIEAKIILLRAIRELKSIKK